MIPSPWDSGFIWHTIGFAELMIGEYANTLAEYGLMAFFLPPIRRSTLCDRCGLRFPEKTERCHRCSDLDEGQLRILKAKVEERKKYFKNLGQRLYLLAAILAVLTLLIVLQL